MSKLILPNFHFQTDLEAGNTQEDLRTEKGEKPFILNAHFSNWI